jgi:hypothetical protein
MDQNSEERKEKRTGEGGCPHIIILLFQRPFIERRNTFHAVPG